MEAVWKSYELYTNGTHSSERGENLSVFSILMKKSYANFFDQLSKIFPILKFVYKMAGQIFVLLNYLAIT